MDECRQDMTVVNYCTVHMSTWDAYDDNKTPCDLARALAAEDKIRRVEGVHRAVVIDYPQYDPITNVRYNIPIKECQECLETFPCTTIRIINDL